MCNLRLSSANTPSALNTLNNFTQVQSVSMSSAAKEFTSNNSNAARTSIRKEKRVVYFNMKDRRR